MATKNTYFLLGSGELRHFSTNLSVHAIRFTALLKYTFTASLRPFHCVSCAVGRATNWCQPAMSFATEFWATYSCQPVLWSKGLIMRNLFPIHISYYTTLLTQPPSVRIFGGKWLFACAALKRHGDGMKTRCNSSSFPLYQNLNSAIMSATVGCPLSDTHTELAAVINKDVTLVRVK